MTSESVFVFLDRWTRRLAVVGFCGLCVIAVLTTWDGAARYLDLPRLSGFADFVSVVLAIVVATCFPVVLLNRTNITVRLLGSALGPRAAAVLEAIGAAVTLVFFVILVWQIVRFTGELYANGRTTPTVEMPLAPWWTVTTAVLALCVPVQAWLTWRLCRAAASGEYIPPPDAE